MKAASYILCSIVVIFTYFACFSGQTPGYQVPNAKQVTEEDYELSVDQFIEDFLPEWERHLRFTLEESRELSQVLENIDVSFRDQASDLDATGETKRVYLLLDDFLELLIYCDSKKEVVSQISICRRTPWLKTPKGGRHFFPGGDPHKHVLLTVKASWLE